MVKKSVFVSFLITASVTFGFVSAVNAQIYNPNQYSSPVFQKMYDRQFMTNLAVNGMMRSQILSDSLKAGKNSRSKRAVKDPLSFSPTGVNIISESEWKQMGKSAQEREDLSALVRYCLKFYTQVAKNDGYAPNDLAYAFEYYVVNNYHAQKDIYRDYRGFKNRGVVDSGKLPDFINSDSEKNIYGQFRSALLSNPAIMKMTDAEKERVTGYLAMMTNLAWLKYDSAVTAGDDEEIERAREMAKQNLEGFFGTSVDKIMITDAGVKLRN